MAFKLTVLAVGLVASNFAYQAFSGHAWNYAADRSFFQTVALGLAYWALNTR